MKLNEFENKLQENPEFVQAMDDLKLHFELAKAVLRARLQKGWSQTELAKAVGTKQANISKIEAGLANPTLTLIRKLTKALELEVRIVGSVAQESQPKFTTSTTREEADTAIRVTNWPVYHSDPQYKEISDASAEGEGYHV
jgi:ribosome-binding protein aMBF1 (putative translation factor)